MTALNAERGREELIVKIGIHEGPCLAVMLNERQDYFGQTVNIASRVEQLEQNLGALSGPAIGDDELAAIDELARDEPGVDLWAGARDSR